MARRMSKRESCLGVLQQRQDSPVQARNHLVASRCVGRPVSLSFHERRASHLVAAAGTIQRRFGAITLEGCLMLHNYAGTTSQGKIVRRPCLCSSRL